MEEVRQEIYARFLQEYNSCAEKFVSSLSDIFLFVKEPWRAEKGKEVEMEELKKIWEELNYAEMAYKDENSYQARMNSICRKLAAI